MAKIARLSLLGLLLSGCGRTPGDGLWDFNVGEEARLVSEEGSDVALERLAVQAGKRGRSGAGRPRAAERITVPDGTLVRILSIEGDDARIEITEGPAAGAIYWVECARLEPLTH